MYFVSRKLANSQCIQRCYSTTADISGCYHTMQGDRADIHFHLKYFNIYRIAQLHEIEIENCMPIIKQIPPRKQTKTLQLIN